jgi:hypothetical protein
MQFRWPFLNKTLRRPADERALDEARANLALAEMALDAARAAYLRLRDSRQPGKLHLQQSALDQALDRYHARRHALRALQQPDAAATPWAGLSRGRTQSGATPEKG